MPKRPYRQRTCLKEHIIATQAPGSLVEALDAEAEREGLSRSAVMRRILLRHVQMVARETTPEVPR